MSDETTIPADAAAPASEAAPAAPPAPVTLTDDALINLGKVNGQDHILPWGEVKKTQVLLPRDYTQKTQALAAERREFEAARQSFASEQAALRQQADQLRSIATDPAKLAMLHMALSHQQAQQTGVAPPPPTALDLQQLRQAMLAEARQAATDTVSSYGAEQQRAQTVSAFERELDAHAKTLTADHPILSKFPRVSDLIYDEVERMAPKTVEEAKMYMATVVDGWKTGFDAQALDTAKATAAMKGKVANAMEPSGGMAMPPTAKKYKGTDDPRIAQDMEAFMRQSLGW